MSNSRDQERFVRSYPDIAAGNPAAVFALENSMDEAGLRGTTISLQVSSAPVRLFHGKISSDPAVAAEYSVDSESVRLDDRARQYAKVAFADFYAQLRVRQILSRDRPVRWIAVQEHQVYGAAERALDRLQIEAIDLVVPDVFPKQSAVETASLHDRVELVVWNQPAYDELRQHGHRARLVRPFLLDGLVDVHDGYPGDTIVAKSSGSGMPKEWRRKLTKELGHTDERWSLHTPGGLYRQEGKFPVDGKRVQVAEFYQSIGYETEHIITYPNECTQSIAALNCEGVGARMLAMPPRGAHEVRNLEFARDAGFLLGEIGFTSCQKPSIPGVNLIDARDIRNIMEFDRPAQPLPGGLLGTVSYVDTIANHGMAA